MPPPARGWSRNSIPTPAEEEEEEGGEEGEGAWECAISPLALGAAWTRAGPPVVPAETHTVIFRFGV